MKNTINTKLDIGTISEILDLYWNRGEGAAPRELATLFNQPEEIILEVIKKYGEKFRKTELVEFTID